MKTRSNTTRWLGLALACGIITFAASVEAKKGGGGKPPPEPPPAAAYDLVWLEPGFDAFDVNESGLVLGRSSLLVPQEENGSTVWFKDDNLDGNNDLLVDLGLLGWGELGRIPFPYDMNDHGVIVGTGNRLLDPTNNIYTTFAWYLAPQMINGQLTWAHLDADAVNPLILPLNETSDTYWDAQPTCINNHGVVALVIEECFRLEDATGQEGYLLLPNIYEVSPEGAVTVEYPAEDLDGDGFNDALISLGTGIRPRDGTVQPLLPQVVNDRGDVAGIVWNGSWGSVGVGRPFVLRPRVDENLGLVWDKHQNIYGTNELAIYLPLPEGVALGNISDMNETGTIVGTAIYAAPKGNRAAVWQVVDWKKGTVTYTEFGSLEDYKNHKISGAAAVNAAGQVVGRSLRYLSGGYVDTKAWLWDANGVALLSDLVPPETGLADGSSSIWGINDSGLIFGSYEYLPFIAVPAEQP